MVPGLLPIAGQERLRVDDEQAMGHVGVDPRAEPAVDVNGGGREQLNRVGEVPPQPWAARAPEPRQDPHGLPKLG